MYRTLSTNRYDGPPGPEASHVVASQFGVVATQRSSSAPALVSVAAWRRGWELVADNLFFLIPVSALLFVVQFVAMRFGANSLTFIAIAWPAAMVLPFAMALAWASFVQSANGQRPTVPTTVRLVSDRLASVYVATMIAVGVWIPLGFFLPSVLFQEDRCYSQCNARSVELMGRCSARVGVVAALGVAFVVAAVALDVGLGALAPGDGFMALWRAAAVALLCGWLAATSVAIYSKVCDAPTLAASEPAPVEASIVADAAAQQVVAAAAGHAAGTRWPRVEVGSPSMAPLPSWRPPPMLPNRREQLRATRSTRPPPVEAEPVTDPPRQQAAVVAPAATRLPVPAAMLRTRW